LAQCRRSCWWRT